MKSQFFAGLTVIGPNMPVKISDSHSFFMADQSRVKRTA